MKILCILILITIFTVRFIREVVDREPHLENLIIPLVEIICIIICATP